MSSISKESHFFTIYMRSGISEQNLMDSDEL